MRQYCFQIYINISDVNIKVTVQCDLCERVSLRLKQLKLNLYFVFFRDLDLLLLRLYIFTILYFCMEYAAAV